MVVYQGGKSRLGKRIHHVISIIEANIYGEKCSYFEPFVGMAGVLRYFGQEFDRNIWACDANKDIILMWQALQQGWVPPLVCSEEEYNLLKNSKKHSAERGFIGTVASWGGIFFHAYRLKYGNTNFMEIGANSLSKILPDIKHVNFMDACSYNDYSPTGFLIYADPPYEGNALGNSKSLFQCFDHDKFWQKMREWSENNIVVVSEWKAPKDFKEIWSAKALISSGKGRKAKKFYDNLYIHESLYSFISPEIKKYLKSV